MKLFLFLLFSLILLSSSKVLKEKKEGEPCNKKLKDCTEGLHCFEYEIKINKQSNQQKLEMSFKCVKKENKFWGIGNICYAKTIGSNCIRNDNVKTTCVESKEKAIFKFDDKTYSIGTCLIQNGFPCEFDSSCISNFCVRFFKDLKETGNKLDFVRKCGTETDFNNSKNSVAGKIFYSNLEKEEKKEKIMKKSKKEKKKKKN